MNVLFFVLLHENEISIFQFHSFALLIIFFTMKIITKYIIINYYLIYLAFNLFFSIVTIYEAK